MVYTVLDLDNSYAGKIIKEILPDKPTAFHLAVLTFSVATPGIAREFAEFFKDYETVEDIERFVGIELKNYTYADFDSLVSKVRTAQLNTA